jgi:hypothetical protein
MRVQETRDGEFKGFTLHTSVGCPRFRDAVVEVEPLRQLYVQDTEHQEDYHELVRVFNARRDKNKRPQQFIEMFIKEG